jgi:hypothetical protein
MHPNAVDPAELYKDVRRHPQLSAAWCAVRGGQEVTEA